MRNGSYGGRYLPKGRHSKKEVFHRRLSLLLSLCMILSIFAGVISFPAVARNAGPEIGQPAIQEDTQEPSPEIVVEETREEIKVRLMRQIRYEGWDPYSGTMSVDEFYALMELFEEGALPLEEERPASETTEPKAESSKIEDSDVETPKIEDSDVETSATDAPETETPESEEPDAEIPEIEESDVETPETEGPDIEAPEADEEDAGVSESEDADAETPETEEPDAEEPETEKPVITAPASPNLAPAKAPAADPEPAPAPIADDQEPTPQYIPREMFMFSGVKTSSTPGTYTTYDQDGNVTSSVTYGSPQEYDNTKDYEAYQEGDGITKYHYPRGLDPYGEYTRPPEGWPGLEVGDKLEAKITVPGINDNNTSVSGNVDQSLFLQYDGVYIRRITAQNNDVTVLGAIRLPKKNPNDPDTWIYYYTNDEKQSTEVSATTLPEGEKFVIHYAHEEYAISYQIRYRVDSLDEDGRANLLGYSLVRSKEEHPFEYCDTWQKYQAYCASQDPQITPDIADWVRQLPQLEHPEQRASLGTRIFSSEFPSKTDEGRYAFTATAPAGYTLAFYLSDSKGEGDVWTNGTAQLVTPEGFNGSPGAYTAVNQGWALGMEPVYYWDSGNKVLSDTSKGPEELITTGTFYNNDVQGDRIVVAVLRKKATPEFNAYTLFKGIDKNGNGHTVDHVSTRGSIALPYVVTSDGETVPYDFEDVYLSVKDRRDEDGNPLYEHTYKFNGNNIVGKYTKNDVERNSSANKTNLQAGNTANGDGWGWNNANLNNERKPLILDTMTQEEDGTYSFQWTFQTNSGSGGYILDTLEINRTGIAIPFYAKYSESGNNSEYPAPQADRLPNYPDDPKNMDMGGLLTWWTRSALPDGTIVMVEYLMNFSGGTQRVYRITVTGATNDITITSMNLMQGTGAKEIAVYQLDGITGATEKNPDGTTSGIRRTAFQYYGDNPAKWSGNINRGAVVVESGSDGTHYYPQETDEKHGGANIRFKLASGYSSPAYLFEAKSGAVIDNQASVQRDSGGALDRSTQSPVVPYVSDGTDPYMRYGTDGTPYPVTAPDRDAYGNILYQDGKPVGGGERLYYYKNETEFVPFTDWTVLRINADAGGDVLVPALYTSSDGVTPDGPALSKNDVVAPSGTYVFQFENDLTQKEKTVKDAAGNETTVTYYMPSGPLKSQYIYSAENNWHYIRLTGHPDSGDGKFALLTIVAFPTRYVVRYKPSDVPDYIVDGKVAEPAHAPSGMPTITHLSSCPTFLQGDPGETDDRMKDQFDDNGGAFYDIAEHADVALELTRPTDPKGHYRFVDWMLVDENDNPVEQHVIDSNNQWAQDENGKYLVKEVHFTSGSFSILEYGEFAIFNSDLGAIDDDIYVLRLIPTWERIEHPYNYTVALNWVDAKGELYEEYFSDMWQDVITNYNTEEGKGPTVKVLTTAHPFQNWIAQHPTYTFWDDVNNAIDSAAGGPSADEKIEAALKTYFPNYDNVTDPTEQAQWEAKYEKTKEALLNRDRYGRESNPEGFAAKIEDGTDADKRPENQVGDDFDRLGNYTYAVNEDYGTISIWMYEDKGGMVFHNEVDPEPFIYNEVFYYTVNQVMEGADDTPLNGEYKAYPSKAYDSFTGEEREVTDSDAWRVNFVNGEIENIVKNDGSGWPSPKVTYFSLATDESIGLYVPAGKYTVTELGSKSGGSYRVEVRYMDKNNDVMPKDSWDIPETASYVNGRAKVRNSDGSDQLAVTVDFEVGEENVVRTIDICNQTSALAFETQVVGPYMNESLGYEAALILPEGASPLLGPDFDGDGKADYYFNFNLYNVEYDEDGGETFGQKPIEKQVDHPGPEPAGRPKQPEKPKKSENPGDWDEVYNQWLMDTAAWKKALAAYLDSSDYKEWLAQYTAWLWWHTWKPNGTTTPVDTGRVVVAQDAATGKWVTQYLLITTDYTPDGDPMTWRRASLQLKSGQRFYMVTTVPKQAEKDEQDELTINYFVDETNAQGYHTEGEHNREGLVCAAELAYELFINTKLEGLPKTGGMGTHVFFLAGLLFLSSGAGLIWLNRRTRHGTAVSVQAERRWAK